MIALRSLPDVRAMIHTISTMTTNKTTPTNRGMGYIVKEIMVTKGDACHLSKYYIRNGDVPAEYQYTVTRKTLNTI